MATKVMDYENTGQANNTALTAANSAYSGGDTLDEVSNTGASTQKYSTNASYITGDTRAIETVVAATSGNTATATASRGWITNTASNYVREVYVFPTIARAMKIAQGKSAYGQELWSLWVKADAKLQLRDSTNAVVVTGTVAVATGQRVRIEVSCRIHATTASSNVLEAKLFNTYTDSAATETVTANGVKLVPGSTTYKVLVGGLSPATSSYTIYSDRLAWSDSAYPGPPGAVGSSDLWDWERQEPYGAGGMNSMVFDPNTADRIYLATDIGGMRLSTDGKSFNIRTRYFESDAMRKTMAVKAFDSPSSPGTTIVGLANGTNPSGFFASTDGGITFTLKNSSDANFHSQSPASPDDNWVPHLPRKGGDWCIDPGNGYMYFGCYKQGVYRSTNGGTTWTRISMAPVTVSGTTYNYFIHWIMVDPNTSGAGTDLLVAVNNSGNGVGGLYRIEDVRSGTGLTATKLTPAGIDSVWDFCFGQSNMLYAACEYDGVWRSPSPYTAWTDISGTRIDKELQWCTVDVYNNGGNDRLLMGAHRPAGAGTDVGRVDANGDAATSGNRYGTVFVMAAAQTGSSPTATYVVDPGTSNFPGGGDQDINVLDFTTGDRFWRADDEPSAMPGRSSGDCAVVKWDPHSPAGASKVGFIVGFGGIPWRSEDNGLTWRACELGVAIGATMSVWKDHSRADWVWGSNQDHDAFYSQDGGNNWARTPDTSNYTTTFWGHADWQGYVYLGFGDPPAATSSGATGQLMIWDGTGTVNWTRIGGESGATNGMPNRRVLAMVTGLKSNGTTVREVVYLHAASGSDTSAGIWWREGRTGSWTQASGNLPAISANSDPITAPISLIWPNYLNGDGNLYIRLRSSTDGGVWRSTDYGTTWSKIYSDTAGASNRNVGYCFAAYGQSSTIYTTGNAGQLVRLRNASTMTLNQAANIDTITTFSRAASGDFDFDGSMYLYCAPAVATDAELWRVQSPPTSGTSMTADDLLDPDTGLASSDQGQAALGLVKNICATNGRVYAALNGGSYYRGQVS